MAVLLLQRDEIPSEKWNDFIATSPQAILYAYSWYLDVVSPNWCALVMEDQGSWQAVMPLPIRYKWFMKVIQQPFFCQFLGVFTLKNTDFQKITDLFLYYISHSYQYISIYSGRFLAPISFPKNYEITSCTNHILSLQLPYKAIKQNYSPDRRQNLQRAKRYNWQVENSEDIQPLIQLFKGYHASQIDGGVAESAYDLLQEVFEILKKKNAIKLIYALHNGQIEAGAMFAIYDHRIIYLFNAASLLGRKGNARTLLIDNMIQQYAKTPYTFDFESPEVPSIAHFYQSFGTQKETYQSIHFNVLPFPLKQIQKWRRDSRHFL